MKIVVDTEHDITQLFSLISEKIKNADVLLENYIVISRADAKIKNDLSDVISDYIIENFEHKEARKYIKPFELSKEDALKILTCLCEDDTLKIKRKKLIENEILPVLSSGHINVDGTVRFRLSEYKKNCFLHLTF